MWIAKNKDTGKEYSKRFDDILDCQNYINTDLKKDLEKANQEYFDKMLKQGRFVIFYCNRILCWHTEQKRFCEGFDF